MYLILLHNTTDLRITWVRKHAKGSHLAFKPRADITRSPNVQGYQLPHEKDLCPPSGQKILKGTRSASSSEYDLCKCVMV